MSNTLDFTLYYKWKDVCHELEIVNDMLLNLKWYEYFIRGDKIKLLEKKQAELNTKWHAYFDLLSECGVFEKLHYNEINFSINPNPEFQ